MVKHRLEKFVTVFTVLLYVLLHFIYKPMYSVVETLTRFRTPKAFALM